MAGQLPIRLQDAVREMRARGLSTHAIEVELIRDGWFHNAGDARQLIYRLEATEATRRRKTRRAVLREVARQVLGIVLGVAVIAGFLLIDGARDSEIAFSFAFSGACLVAGGLYKLLRFFLARADEDELIALSDVVVSPPWRAKPEDEGLSELRQEQLKRQATALKDAQDSGIRPL